MNDINLLQRITIPEPCPKKWRQMKGDSQVRFCPQCEKSVYNLSAMTAVEAERVLREHEGELCGQVLRRRDGSIVTQPSWLEFKRWPAWLRGAAAMLAGGCAWILSGCSTAGAVRSRGSIAPLHQHQLTQSQPCDSSTPE